MNYIFRLLHHLALGDPQRRAGDGDGKIVGAASQNAIDNDIKINKIIKTAAGVLGGGGGGRLTLAQGAGKNADKMDEAIQTAVNLIKG